MAAALGVADRLGARGTSLADGARNAFVDGMDVALLVSSGTLLGLAVLFLFVIPAAKPKTRPEMANAEPDNTLVPSQSGV